MKTKFEQINKIVTRDIAELHKISDLMSTMCNRIADALERGDFAAVTLGMQDLREETSKLSMWANFLEIGYHAVVRDPEKAEKVLGEIDAEKPLVVPDPPPTKLN